jgi:hypothetical protein
MAILPALAREFQFLFPLTESGQERLHWLCTSEMASMSQFVIYWNRYEKQLF